MSHYSQVGFTLPQPADVQLSSSFYVDLSQIKHPRIEHLKGDAVPFRFGATGAFEYVVPFKLDEGIESIKYPFNLGVFPLIVSTPVTGNEEEIDTLQTKGIFVTAIPDQPLGVQDTVNVLVSNRVRGFVGNLHDVYGRRISYTILGPVVIFASIASVQKAGEEEIIRDRGVFKIHSIPIPLFRLFLP